MTNGRGAVTTGFSKLAANNVLKVVGRVGMVLAVPMIGWFASYLSSQSQAIANVSNKVDTVQKTLSDSISEVSGRTTILETKITIGQKAREDFQEQMIATTNKILDQQATLLQQNAAILSTLGAYDKRFEALERKP